MKNIEVSKIIDPITASDGAGVKLKRSIGVEPNYFDPFLMLDELVKSNKLQNIFDDIFSIEEIGVYKPDSKVYDLPINQYQIHKNEVAFLSANTWDVSGGGNYGYNSIWVNRSNNTFDNLDYVPKHQIKDLSKLLDICLLYTSPSPRDKRQSRMPSSA